MSSATVRSLDNVLAFPSCASHVIFAVATGAIWSWPKNVATVEAQMAADGVVKGVDPHLKLVCVNGKRVA